MTEQLAVLVTNTNILGTEIYSRTKKFKHWGTENLVFSECTFTILPLMAKVINNEWSLSLAIIILSKCQSQIES